MLLIMIYISGVYQVKPNGPAIK